ncbi:hypothetical protein RAD15_37460 [Bradyrhizobium sp. 14AA]
MDREMHLRHLREAERHVAEGEQHIAVQEERIAVLDRAGCETELARELLATFRVALASHIAHRDLIIHEINRRS